MAREAKLFFTHGYMAPSTSFLEKRTTIDNMVLVFLAHLLLIIITYGKHFFRFPKMSLQSSIFKRIMVYLGSSMQKLMLEYSI